MPILSWLPNGAAEDPSVILTLTLEGAYGDIITITDLEGNPVAEPVEFGASNTAETTIEIPASGGEYLFTTNVDNIDGTNTKYSKVVALDSSTTNVKAYPSNSLYWYGVGADDWLFPTSYASQQTCSNASSKCWKYDTCISGATIVRTKDTNNIALGLTTSTSLTSASVYYSHKINCANYNSIKLAYNNVNTAPAGYGISLLGRTDYSWKDCAIINWGGSDSDIVIRDSGIPNVTAIKTRDISSITSNIELLISNAYYFSSSNSNNNKVYAVCLEQKRTLPTTQTDSVTLTLEGAKADNITIYDTYGEVVDYVTFDSSATSKSVTLSIRKGGEKLKFVSSVAKDTTDTSKNYYKWITLTNSTESLDDIYIPLVPTMTSNTTPSGVVSAYGTASGEAYNAFNGDNANSQWVGNSVSAYLQYAFESPITINAFSIEGGRSGSPTSGADCTYTISGSNDGTTFTPIVSKTVLGANQKRINKFDIDNEIAYKIYRLTFSSFNTADNNIAISHLQFYSVTKGVKVMPSGAIYWYGNETNLYGALTVLKYSSTTITRNADHFKVYNSGSGIAYSTSGLVTSQKVDLSEWSYAKAVVTVNRIDTSQAQFGASMSYLSSNSSLGTNDSNVKGRLPFVSSVCTKTLGTIDLRNVTTSDYYCLFGQASTIDCLFYAIWFE